MKLAVLCLNAVLLIPFLFFSLYLAFLSLLAMFRRLKPITEEPSKYRKFAVLVPAHNEELIIEQTLDSLAKIDYPSAQFDVKVIADNCTDQTASICRAKQVKVLERVDPSHIGKGYALKWCFDQLIASDTYDAFVVIDADTIVSANLLKVFNTYLEDGAECVQCSYMAIPQPGSWSPEITRVAMMLYNYVRPLGRMSIGSSAGLYGNGMCLSRDLLLKNPWDSFTRTEDLEYSIRLAMAETRVQFAPEAVVRAVMPTDPHNAESQRRRWEVGRLPLLKKHTLQLLSTGLKKRSFMIIDRLMDLIMPPFVDLVTVAVITFLLEAILTISGQLWLLPMTLLWGGVLLLDTIHVVCGLSASHAGWQEYLALLSAPRYALWKLQFYIKTMLNGDDKEWIRTLRMKDER